MKSLCLAIFFLGSFLHAQPEEIKVPFDKAVIPIPDDGRGLKFQMARINDTGPHLFKPICAARFGPDGRIYAGFPKLSLVVVFAPDDGYSSRYVGNKQFGGKGEWIGNPASIHFVDGRVLLAGTNEKEFLAYDSAWQPVGVYESRFRGAVPGPGGMFVSGAPGEDFHIYLCDSKKRLLRGFRLPGLAVADPGGPRLYLRVLPDWRILGWTEAGALYKLTKKGEILAWIQLNNNGEGPFRVMDAVWLKGSYWVLIHANKQSSVLVLGANGDIQSHWRVPFPADALDVNQRELALTLRAAGVIRTWWRP